MSLHPSLPSGRPGEQVATMDEADCISCEQGEQGEDTCPKSPRACRHHCNHSWSHECCCYCKLEWGDEGEAEAVPDPEETGPA